MTTYAEYIANRKRFSRPQGVLFSDVPWDFDGLKYIPPDGLTSFVDTGYDEFDEFIILTDGNRTEIKLDTQRIETRERMIDGSMRSYWVADKRTLSLSWSDLPSRAFLQIPDIDKETGVTKFNSSFTADGGAGGNEMLEWHRRHPESFWVLLSYDRYPLSTGASTPAESFGQLDQYTEQFEMFFASFDHAVVKRSQTMPISVTVNGEQRQLQAGVDLWNLSMSLEEV